VPRLPEILKNKKHFFNSIYYKELDNKYFLRGNPGAGSGKGLSGGFFPPGPLLSVIMTHECHNRLLARSK
jgi:hypothetical protein